MKSISVSEAFSYAPPRSACVLCLKGELGSTDMILTEWFTWLNIKRNPMISFSMPRGAARDLREGDDFVLAFPPTETALKYKSGINISSENTLPAVSGSVPFPVPGDTVVALHCTLAGAYNYPFKRVRIFNCNLEEAYGAPERM